VIIGHLNKITLVLLRLQGAGSQRDRQSEQSGSVPHLLSRLLVPQRKSPSHSCRQQSRICHQNEPCQQVRFAKHRIKPVWPPTTLRATSAWMGVRKICFSHTHTNSRHTKMHTPSWTCR
jgi:hypothetical protein